jgi:LPS-assembly lipoprotein
MISKLSPRAFLTAVALGLGALVLGGCGGFTPLYAAQGVSTKMAAIEVSRPDGRTGFLMGQYLDDELAKNRDEAPTYRLLLKTAETRIPRGIRVDNVASRYEVDLNTSYTLVEIATRKVVTAGVVKINITYDSADQPYAGIAAEQDGQQRAAEQSAERIRLELASYFASPRPTPPASALTTTNIATYSERLQGATVESPRQRALGQPSAQGGQADMFGQPLSSTTTPETEPQAFSPSQDPTNAKAPAVRDPAAIDTLPEQ